MTLQLLEALTAQTYSRSDFAYRLSLVRELLEYLFFIKRSVSVTTETVKEFAAQSKKPLEDIAFLQSLPASFLTAFTQDSFYHQLDELVLASRQLQTLSLTVPVALTRADVEAIGRWAHEHVDPRLLIDIDIDPSIAVGCRIGWSNRLYDFSFEHYLTVQKKELQARFAQLRSVPVLHPVP